MGVDGAIVEAVKLADDRSGDVIVRFYESLGGRASAVVRPGFPVAQAQIVDLLERPVGASRLTPGDDGRIELALRPFQILTLRLARGRRP